MEIIVMASVKCTHWHKFFLLLLSYPDWISSSLPKKEMHRTHFVCLMFVLESIQPSWIFMSFDRFICCILSKSTQKVACLRKNHTWGKTHNSQIWVLGRNNKLLYPSIHRLVKLFLSRLLICLNNYNPCIHPKRSVWLVT